MAHTKRAAKAGQETPCLHQSRQNETPVPRLGTQACRVHRGRGKKPSRAGSDRMAARRAVPVATEEATGIDSRDAG